MPTLIPGQPITIPDPHLLVENQFAPGRYRFQLVVTDEAGLESDPAELFVLVRDIVRPVPPTRPDIREIDPDLLRRIRRQPDITPDIGRVIRPIRRPP